MFALVDCNSFFCSVEKVFHPGLDGRPVCVLSSNDGCIVALTPEAKAVGLHRGDPIFKMKDIVEKHQVILFSTNMPLYAAMSRRVTSILRLSVHHVENYSIDESFCDLKSFGEHFDLTKLMREVRQRIKLWTDIPVSIGIAPSKTLAKMGSKFAKQYQGYRGVCMIDTEEKRRKALEIFALSDVWGIGRRTLEVLNYYGVHTPLQFADKKESWVRAHFHQPGVQTWMELNGIPCIDTSEVIRNQNICTSRSFGDMVSDLPSLKASVASFASSCANKLRGQQSLCQSVTVFVSSNSFRTDLPQYGNAATALLATPTADTLEINKAAMQCLESVSLPGIMDKKSGALLGKILPAYPAQMELFNSPVRRMRRENLMHALDDINQRYGAKTLHLAVEDCGHQPWHVKCEHRSPNYLTDINEILTIRI